MATATKPATELRHGDRVHLGRHTSPDVVSTVTHVGVRGTATNGYVLVYFTDDAPVRLGFNQAMPVEVEDPDWDGTYDPFASEDHQHPQFMACYQCLPVDGVMRRCLGEGHVTRGADPTQTYQLDCGHLAI